MSDGNPAGSLARDGTELSQRLRAGRRGVVRRPSQHLQLDIFPRCLRTIRQKILPRSLFLGRARSMISRDGFRLPESRGLPGCQFCHPRCGDRNGRVSPWFEELPIGGDQKRQRAVRRSQRRVSIEESHTQLSLDSRAQRLQRPRCLLPSRSKNFRAILSDAMQPEPTEQQHRDQRDHGIADEPPRA